MANRMAIHHPRALGAHHVEPTAGFWCLRWGRDSHRTITPSGRTRSTNVAGAPTLSMWPLRFRVVMTASHPWRSNHHLAPRPRAHGDRRADENTRSRFLFLLSRDEHGDHGGVLRHRGTG